MDGCEESVGFGLLLLFPFLGEVFEEAPALGVSLGMFWFLSKEFVGEPVAPGTTSTATVLTTPRLSVSTTEFGWLTTGVG